MCERSSELAYARIDISSLLQCELIARKIIQNLDCQSLLHARLVSSDWAEAVDRARLWKTVLDNDVQWKQLYSILNTKGNHIPQSENDRTISSTFYQNLYNNIHEKILALEESWITNESYSQVIKQTYLGYVERNNFNIFMNEKFIVKRKSSHAIELLNRWTWEIDHVFDLGPDNRVMMKSADISNDFLAIGCNRGQILIWCLKTKKLICKLFDDPVLLCEASFAERVMASRADCNYVQFDPSGRTLLSCMRNNVSYCETLTLRSITTDNAMTISHQEKIEQFYAQQIHIDHSRIFILKSDGKEIQVRSASSLCLINIISIDSEPFTKCFKAYGSWLITAGSEHISLWNIQDGKHFRRIQMDSTDGNLKTIGLVGNKYLVSCHVTCFSSDFFVLGIKVWNLTACCDPAASIIKPLFTHVINTKSWHDANIEGIRDSLVENLKVDVDDYQIACLLTWEYDFVGREIPTPMLYTINLLKV